MRYISAYMLCLLSGKVPKADDIETVLSSVGVECDKKCVTQLLKDLNDKSIETLIAEGTSKLASLPAGGASLPAADQGVSAAAPASAKVEEAKVEKESESESDADMGFGLFD